MDAPLLVEVGELRHEDWTAFRSNLPVSVRLVRASGDGPLAPGDRARLELSVEEYRDGDLAHVCLPPALARVHGGGRVQAFSVDFAGKTSAEIELAVVGGTTPPGGPHRQHCFACVRNMFEAERIGNPGLMEVALAWRRTPDPIPYRHFPEDYRTPPRSHRTVRRGLGGANAARLATGSATGAAQAVMGDGRASGHPARAGDAGSRWIAIPGRR